jgi:hypothetical protein
MRTMGGIELGLASRLYGVNVTGVHSFSHNEVQ